MTKNSVCQIITATGRDPAVICTIWCFENGSYVAITNEVTRQLELLEWHGPWNYGKTLGHAEAETWDVLHGIPLFDLRHIARPLI
jgi:hypothetical protein